jgi:glutamyl-tRNA reductase
VAAGRAALEDLGVYSWETASLDRDALSLLESEIGAALECSEGVPVVTCQRYEIIALRPTIPSVEPAISTGATMPRVSTRGDASTPRVETRGIPTALPPGISTHAPRAYHGHDALLHLAKVCAGLESLVLGEAEVLGQVRSALAEAAPELRRLTAPAVAAARALRRDEGFTQHAGFALDAALEYAGLTCEGALTVIGGGPMGRRIAERAAALGFSVTIVARRPLPLPPNIHYHAFDHLSALPATDVLVSCLGHGAPLLTRDLLPQIRCAAIDLATPRNLADDLPTPVVRLADLIEAQRRFGEDLRRAELRLKLEALLDARLLTGDRESPLGSLREEVERIRQLEIVRTLRLHPELPADKVDAITRSLINQVFHGPSQRLRQPENTELAAAVAALFATNGEEMER